MTNIFGITDTVSLLQAVEQIKTPLSEQDADSEHVVGCGRVQERQKVACAVHRAGIAGSEYREGHSAGEILHRTDDRSAKNHFDAGR